MHSSCEETKILETPSSSGAGALKGITVAARNGTLWPFATAEVSASACTKVGAPAGCATPGDASVEHALGDVLHGVHDRAVELLAHIFVRRLAIDEDPEVS